MPGAPLLAPCPGVCSCGTRPENFGSDGAGAGVVWTGCRAPICATIRFMFGHSFSTWRLHLRGETIRSASDVGWLRNLTVERMMRTDVGKVLSTTTIAACRREFLLGSRPAVIVVDNSDAYCGLVLLPELFSGDLDAIADEIQVVELAKYTDVVLLPEMNVKSAMKMFDDAEAEILAVIESEDSRKVVGFLSESFARRRYVEEIDKATRGVLGALT